MKVSLITGRTIDQGTGKERGKLLKEYQQKVAICEMDPHDMRELGVRENENIRVSTEFGSVIVQAIKSDCAPHPAVIFMPYGPWANMLMCSETHGTGMPSLKGVSAEVESASEERVLSVPELLEMHFRKG
ncbi:molybdopterin dinucleotide-binding protein [Candidatus Bathyarchaeota archaeon]|nr:molybdopterin dinucleotide-binding protein [Candidatus Bathyarchaeota archaeon]NIU80994.1 molybdopterin dinucleotide-binding protein [Candidatus Bathyarchaeota archaeon]NIV67639.1 molybdopterin dinucleotide-binding protein [Candidatus Bathyarchaeota archaeon]NIW16174.1 molybdopterin dinucleotide-binding protein [Candidatus Bathyarchaeota archaeon]NIW34260.1 molybdopterin dinucleotide-binding protein [Candidatus Bathyarchaeota archaeon]